jgi:hypothetical protein
MGKSNRERRAAKKRKADHRRSQHHHHSAHAGPGWSASRPDLRSLLILAAGAQSPMPDEIWAAISAELGVRGSSGTALVLDDLVCDVLNSAWEGGWQPAEVVRAVRRQRGQEHADLVRTAIAASHALMGHAPPQGWSEQLSELEATTTWWGKGRDWLGPWSLRYGRSYPSALALAIEALGVLMCLPVMEAVLPPPSQWGTLGARSGAGRSAVDDAVLAKVRALLAKAESTNFEHEADALTAKAQELMARHAIDEALATQAAGRPRQDPSLRRMPVDDPYAKAKSALLAVVASANNVRCVWADEYALMTLVGFETDLGTVEVLFTSLLMQASKSLLAKGRVTDARGRSRTRSFRQSFFVAFADRIHERLVMAARQARESAEDQLGRDLLPVLAGRAEEVDDYTAKLFPHLVKIKGSSITNRDGWLAGRAAAEVATLGVHHERLDGTNG